MSQLETKKAVFSHVLLYFVRPETSLMVVSARLYRCEECSFSDQETLVHAFVDFVLAILIVLC
jgi:hypothetical protein